MKILITGSEGTLGKPLTAELQEQGHLVYGCDLKHASCANYMRADIGNMRQLDRAFEASHPDFVYHLAAEFGRANGQQYYEQLWQSNCVGTRNVIEQCLRSHSTLIFASSSEAYGDATGYSNGEPFQEEWLYNHAPQFYNEYSLTKWANERQIFMAARQQGLKAIILRFFNIFGPGEYYSPYRSVVCQFVYCALTNQPVTVYLNSRRSHLYVDDWCETAASVVSAEMPKASFGVPIFNIGSEEIESAKETWTRVAEAVETRSVVTYLQAEAENIASKCPDLTAAKRWLSHNPQMRMEQGIERTIEWMKRTYGI